MSHITPAMQALIGVAGEVQTAPTPLGPDTLRRFTQAVMESDPVHWDPIEADWDGMGGTVSKGLPSLNLPFKRLLNGGYACEFFQLAQLGDLVSRQSRYVELSERESSSGPMIVFKTETLYTNQHGEKLLRIVHTELAR